MCNLERKQDTEISAIGPESANGDCEESKCMVNAEENWVSKLKRGIKTKRQAKYGNILQIGSPNFDEDPLDDRAEFLKAYEDLKGIKGTSNAWIAKSTLGFKVENILCGSRCSIPRPGLRHKSI